MTLLPYIYYWWTWDSSDTWSDMLRSQWHRPVIARSVSGEAISLL